MSVDSGWSNAAIAELGNAYAQLKGNKLLWPAVQMAAVGLLVRLRTRLQRRLAGMLLVRLDLDAETSRRVSQYASWQLQGRGTCTDVSIKFDDGAFTRACDDLCILRRLRVL